MRTEINNKYFIKSSLAAIIKLVLVFTCLVSVNSLAAEENKTPEETSQNTRVQTEEQPQTTKPENKPAPQQQSTKKIKRASRFKPSEEISEDYSVPFPVDI